MLMALRIRNLALVEDLTLDWNSGFTVLTGETGAGKSLLVDALSLLIGARADAEVVRIGAERAQVEAVVEGRWDAWAAFLAEKGLPEEQPVVLRREVAAGRSRAWINGSPCTTADLREAGRIWMRLASQHDHQHLLQEERHLGLLDEVLGLASDLSEAVQSVRDAHQALRQRQRSEADRLERMAWLEEHLEALKNLAPKAQEWSQLRAEREPLRHASQLESLFQDTANALNEAVPLVDAALRAQTRGLGLLADLGERTDRLRSALLELEDLRDSAQDEARHWSRLGVERLEQVETRLAQYERLARRHRCEPDELAAVFQTLQQERLDLLHADQSLAALELALNQAVAEYLQRADPLHQTRLQNLAPLEKAVHARLARLGMPGARLQVRLTESEEAGSPVIRHGRPLRLHPQGYSHAVLWIEPNVGEGFKPLARIASGGELSRVLLAFLGSASERAAEGEPLTLVLDEVDAGLGGETALAVGEALQDLGRRQQVLSVTHLAQVAARADHHGFLSKETRDGRTRSHLQWLHGEPRVRELARLLSGQPDRPEALEHARLLGAQTS